MWLWSDALRMSRRLLLHYGLI